MTDLAVLEVDDRTYGRHNEGVGVLQCGASTSASTRAPYRSRMWRTSRCGGRGVVWGGWCGGVVELFYGGLVGVVVAGQGNRAWIGRWTRMYI